MGVDIVIFVTTGTTEFPFSRMDKIAHLLSYKFPKEKIIYQSKSSSLKSNKNLKIIKELEFSGFLSLIKNSRVIIAHGGPATIYLALSYAKTKPFVVARDKKYKEHVIDQQLHFAQFMAKKGLVKVLRDTINLEKEILVYCLKPDNNVYKSDSKNLKKLIEGLERLIDIMI